jgi:hypothetical protein
MYALRKKGKAPPAMRVMRPWQRRGVLVFRREEALAWLRERGKQIYEKSPSGGAGFVSDLRI